MALEHYTDTFWFPNGQLAKNIAARVFSISFSTLATLWADAAGTMPLAQPVSTSAAGVLDFWAETGDYWLHLDTESFRISVGMSQFEAGLSTGTASGGEFTASATPGSVDITPLVGYVVTHTQDGDAPTIVRVVSPQRTEALAGASLTRPLTWWLMDSAGTVTQQAARPSNSQRRSHLVLGLTAYDGVSAIVFDQTLPTILPQPQNQLIDLMGALGPFSVSGNLVSPVPGTLSFDKTEGSVFAHAFNHIPTPTDPHVSTLVAQTPVNFSYNTQQSFSEGPINTALDPASYDVAGTVTPVANPAFFTVQRVWGYPLNDVLQQVRVQYGQDTYATMTDAVNAIGNTDFIPNPEAEPFSALLAHIVIRADATDLSDLTQALVLRAGKFDAP